jgi:bifunctional non-homologous end joining protein LigD
MSGKAGPLPCRRENSPPSGGCRGAVVASGQDSLSRTEHQQTVLAEFYAAIADFILPHVVHRPLTLLRCPDGRQEGCFYQKHLGESLPDTLRTIPIVEKDGMGEYVVIDDVRGLISLVQLGCWKCIPGEAVKPTWKNRISSPFDLDPGPDVGWPEVIAGARLLRRRLEELDLKSYVKTSGGKGCIWWSRSGAGPDGRKPKAFAGAVARDLVRRRPDLFTAEMKKAKRQGRIFIDYLRNDRGATTVAAYSTRARAGAPVSTPIRWERTEPDHDPGQVPGRQSSPQTGRAEKRPLAGFFHHPPGNHPGHVHAGISVGWPGSLSLFTGIPVDAAGQG